MMDIKDILLLLFINSFDKNTAKGSRVSNRMNNWLKKCIKQLLGKLKKEKYIHHLKTIFGVII